VGFNDATLGVARKATLSSALSIWGDQLRSSQTIKVAVRFDSLPCASGAATLGAGEPISYLQNFVGAPVQNRLYPVALAEALARQNLNSDGNEIVMRINADVDQGCAGSISGFDYNTNPSTPTAPNKVRALPVMLHELAHGLGFFTPICLVNLPGGCSSTPGQWPYGGYPNNVLDRWSDFLRDGPSGSFWSTLSSSQRIASARSGNLVWDGPRVTAALPALNLNAAATLGNRIKMHSPATLSASASVNHFTSDATPNLLMEPDYSQVASITSLDLTTVLLADLGWPLSTDPIVTTTLITSDQPDPSVINSAYTVNVTVNSLDGVPMGTVTIRDGTEPKAASCTANVQSLGQASCVMTSTFAGNRTLTATYAGNGVFQSSSDTESHNVTGGPTTTLITNDQPDPSQEGQQYFVNVRVTSLGGNPSGNVSIRDGNESNAATCNASLTGTPATGACVITSTIAGNRTLTATYLGSGGFLPSSDTEAHAVQSTAVDLTMSTFAQYCSVNGVSTMRRSITVGKVGPYNGPEAITVTIPEIIENLGPAAISPPNSWNCISQISDGFPEFVCTGNYGITPSIFFVSQPMLTYPMRRLSAFIRDSNRALVRGDIADPTLPNDSSGSLTFDPVYTPGNLTVAPCPD